MEFQHRSKIIQGTSINSGRVPRARHTDGISVEFYVRSKFGVRWFKICLADHNEILHTSRQCNCRDVCKISLWSIEYISNQSTTNVGRTSNSIKISLAGRAPSSLAGSR